MTSFSSLRQFSLLLGAACFAAALVALSPGAFAQQIALTFDDLPAHGALPAGTTRIKVIQDLLAALKASGTPPVYGFVNGVGVARNPGDEGVLTLWRSAGYPLGNHTWSHMNLNEHTAAEWEADLLKNEPLLQAQMPGQEWRWLRFPYLAEGDTPEKTAEVRRFLVAHHYRIAAVTMSFADYLFNETYVRCVAKHDDASVALIKTGYLKAAKDEWTYRRSLAMAEHQGNAPLVLLLHVGALDAEMMPHLLQQYKDDGGRFVSLEQAEAHSIGPAMFDPAMPIKSYAEAAKGGERKRPSHDTSTLDQLCR